MATAVDGWGVDNVTVCWGDRVALDSVSLSAGPGEVVAVVGGDGAGKSTLLRALIGRVLPTAGTITAPAAIHLGYQPAVSGAWGQLSVDENLDLVAGVYRLDPARERLQRTRLLDAAGLMDVRGRRAAQLSGGMRQKLGFCMAMLHQPVLLVLDEPSTGVDPVSRVELWGLITDAAAQGAAVVLSTTYLDEAERVHEVLVLDAGVPLLEGTPAQVIASSPGTVTTVGAPTDPGRAWRRGRAWRQWHPGPPAPGDTVVSPDMEDAVVAAALSRRAPGSERTAGAPIGADNSDAAGSELGRVDAVTKRFGHDPVVEGVSMSVRGGEIVGVIGANGAGKTTLIRMQLGLLLPTEGRVTLFGEAPSRVSRRRLGYVPQGLGLYRDLTVGENLAFVAGAYGVRPSLDAGLVPLAGALVASIGLGRQRQLAFTCALSHSPELLVLDEPTSGVDPISRARLWDTIHAQAESGVGVLVSTHYMQEAEQCDRLLLMDLGRVVAQGTVADIVGDTTAVQVDTEHWSAAFTALTDRDLPVALSGIRVRVAGTAPDVVRGVLAAAGVDARLEIVPATLEEKMTLITRNRTVTPQP
ncbi:MAG: ABC transporter ATP-binding protein [Actinobacteria bacterium]|nr:ABC transporter ATP-binding protein [Actinomycetota bacterium]